MSEPTPGGPAAPAPDRGEGIARNTAYAMAVQLTTAAFTAVLTLYLVRALGPAGYGVFALSVGIGALVALPSDLGISPSTARFVAEHLGDRPAISAFLAGALKLKLVAAVLVSSALFAAAGLVADAYASPELVWPLRGVAIALFGQSIMMLYGGAFVALRRVSWNLRIVFSESAMETVASFGLVLLGGGAAGAAFGRATGYVFGGVMAVVLTARILGRPAIDIRRAAGRRGRQIAGYAGALLVVDAAFTLVGQIDSLVIGAVIGTTGVGLYQAPIRFVTFLHYPGYALASGVTPRLARTSDQEPDAETFRSVLRYLIIFQAALTVPIVVWPRPIVSLLLGDGYEASASVLQALAPFVFLSGLAPLVSLAVNYLGEVRRRIPVAVLTVVVNLGIDVALVPQIGLVGAAIGSDVAYTLYVAGHLWICLSVLGLGLRPFALTLFRSLCAAIAMGLALAAFGTGELSVLDWAGGALAGATAFLVVIVATGEVSARDLRAGRQLIVERLGRVRG